MQHLSMTGKPWVGEITPSGLPLSAGVISVGQNETKHKKRCVWGRGAVEYRRSEPARLTSELPGNTNDTS